MATKLQDINPKAIYDIWLSTRAGISSYFAKLLIEYFGSSERIYNSGRRELAEINGLRAKMLSELMDKDLSKAKQILSDCEHAGITVLTISNKDYPDRLRNICDPPIVLYIKGNLPPVDDMPVVGVVGSRNCTPYGIKHARETGRDLSRHGIIVTTGLAKGIDTAAAVGALTGDMPVIGVVGCGADIVYPAQNRSLFEQVINKGAVVSEYPPGTEAQPYFFPARNRIISGLSIGVAVIEAPEKSGALITAHDALEQNRDVFVLPGNVDAMACVGSNKLLRAGAIPFFSAEDIIEEYRNLYKCIKKPIDKSKAVDYIDVDKPLDKLCANERVIVESIGKKSLYIDEIIESTGINAPVAMASLTGLEIGGYVRRNEVGKWEIAQ